MEIARERFLDDTRRFHLTISLRSRTPEMHSTLSGLCTVAATSTTCAGSGDGNTRQQSSSAQSKPAFG